MKFSTDNKKKYFHIQRGIAQLILASIILYGLVGRFEELGSLYLILLFVSFSAVLISTIIVWNFKVERFFNSVFLNLVAGLLFFLIGNFLSEELTYEVIEEVVVEAVDADGTAQAIGIRVFDYSGWEFLWIYLINGVFAFTGYIRLKETSQTSDFSREVFKVKLGNKVHFLPFKDMFYIEASGNYINIFSDDKKYTSRMAIQEFMEQAEKGYLLRIHRSFAINVNKISELTSSEDGHAVILTNDAVLKVGKNYKAALFDHLGIRK